MMDPATIAVTVKAVSDGIVGLISLGKGSGDRKLQADLAERLLPLQTHVVALNSTIMELQGENTRLQRELNEATEQRSIRELYKLDGNAYWRNGVHHCINCMEANGVGVTLVISRGEWYCNTCHNSYPRTEPPG